SACSSGSLRYGSIYFEALSLLEERALQAEVDAMTAAQGGRTKGRKTRTDKGKTHASAALRTDEDHEEEGEGEGEEGGCNQDDYNDDDDDDFNAGDRLGDNDVERDTRANASTASRAPSGAAGLSAVPDVEHNTRNATAATHAPSGATGFGAVPSRNTTTIARTDIAPISAVGTTAADVPFTNTTNTMHGMNDAAAGNFGVISNRAELSYTPAASPSSPSTLPPTPLPGSGRQSSREAAQRRRRTQRATPVRRLQNHRARLRERVEEVEVGVREAGPLVLQEGGALGMPAARGRDRAAR
ncbi:hypothetical protein B0H14DRAFT_3587428, partial [Mycena olivaceomarginata]